ncbi:uncharacterized protein LOC113357877 [Papaver somniferum]|uniref:uncharacterized protein LOC113357877 n=1 Tax=Papaver somniferum TaxID=3469 RepID=UPI000E6F7944|nr:uncharacterized protein LOC113357877 [Papaver somniferum]
MLKWMGGSRRKVTNSRKSTHKRQRQYFEQKKRQKHTNGEVDAEGTHGSAEYHRTPKSLDILSLLNLTVEAKGDNSGCNNATDGPALRVSPLNYQVPEDIHKVAEIPVLRFSPVNYQLQKGTKTKSPAKEEKCAPPQKKFSSDPHNTATFHKYSSNKNGDKSDCWKNATETQFSLLDLLGEDGSNEKAEGSPVRECHVAFSVEGLGKTRMETPVHSPQQQCRLPSPPKAAKRHLSSNKYKMNELKQNAVLYDTDMPTSDTSFDLPFNSRDIRDNHGNSRSDNLFVKGCKPLDGLNFKLDSLFSERCLNNNLEDKSEDPWNDRSGFLDDDSTDEKMLDESTKSQLFEIDYYSPDDFCRENTYDMHPYSFEDPSLQKREKINDMHAFAFEDPYLQKREKSHNTHAFAFEDTYLQNREKSPNKHAFAFEDPYVQKRENTYKTHEFAFEDPYLQKRCRSSVTTERDILSEFEPTAPYFEHLHSRKDKDFMTFDDTRRRDRKWDSEPTWSYFENEDLKDNLSLLSEESSSSTAVWGDKVEHSTLNPMGGPEGSMRKHESDVDLSPGRMYNPKHLYAEGKELGKETGVTKLSRRNDIYKAKKDLEPKFNALYEEEYTVGDTKLSNNSFLRTPLESSPTSFECKIGSEGLSSACPHSKLYTNKQPLGKRRTPDAPSKQAPPFSFKEDLFQQPLIPVHSDPISRKLDTPHSKLCSNKQALGKRRTPDAPSKQAPPFSFEEDVSQQSLSPVHSDPNSFSITESISRKLDTPQMSRSEGEPSYSSHRIDPQGGAAFPALPKERNDDSECEDRPEHQESGYGFLSGTEKEVSVGINGILSQDEKTVDDSDSKDSESKYKEIRDETPELMEKSKARDSSENSEEISCATTEILDKLKICMDDKRHHFHAGLPLPIQSGTKVYVENEETEELERIEGGKRGKSKDTAYMVMLESYVLQLLCVQKVLKKEGTSEHEPLSQ